MSRAINAENYDMLIVDKPVQLEEQLDEVQDFEKVTHLAIGTCWVLLKIGPVKVVEEFVYIVPPKLTASMGYIDYI